MKILIAATFAALTLASTLGVAQAAETKMSPDAGRTLPAVCTGGSDMAASTKPDSMGSMDGMGVMGPAGTMDQAHQAMMAGMQSMQENMTKGMMASDIDVAFICGMIPHHQGAIDMAEAELKYGKDPFARKMAQAIIAAQEKETAQMLDWLKARSK